MAHLAFLGGQDVCMHGYISTQSPCSRAKYSSATLARVFRFMPGTLLAARIVDRVLSSSKITLVQAVTADLILDRSIDHLAGMFLTRRAVFLSTTYPEL
jgi:hypothetical protein